MSPLLTLLHLVALAAAPPAAVEVTIELAEEETVRVDARYRLSGGDGSVRFHARRFAGQEIALRHAGSALLLGPGAASFDAAPGAGGDVTVRYELRGRRDRVPLFAPDRQVPGPVEVHVRGLVGDRDVRGGFPRLERGTGGAWTVRLDDLPGALRMPPPRGSFTVGRAAEAAVVALVVGATGAWIARRRRRVGSPRFS